MKRTVIAILAMCALIPVIAHGADDRSFLFRFIDVPGTYRIKIQSMKKKFGPRVRALYEPLETVTYEDSGDSTFPNYFPLPHNATHIRINIRKKENGKFERSGDVLIPADKLHEMAVTFQGSKQMAAGIAMKNQFENLAGAKAVSYDIDSDSLWIPSPAQETDNATDMPWGFPKPR